MAVPAVMAVMAVMGTGPAGATTSTTSTTTTTSTTSTTTSTTTSAAGTGGPRWTVYHQDVAGAGVATPIGGVTTSRRAWTSPTLDGKLYGEPLVSGSLVYVATENDTVYALSAATGVVVWSTRVGTPVPSSALPCGDITPDVGITGTPVIDPARSELFVVADELVDGAPAHRLVGLDTATGRVELTQSVDPTGSTPSALLQRSGLTLDAGQVVFGFGGNYGDCSTYRGWVVAVAEAGGTPTEFAVDAARGESQGAIWMGGGAPAVDGAGNIWVAVGNGSVTSSSHPYDDSDSVLELSSSLALLQYFAPRSWASDNANDLDLSTVPALLSDGQVVAAGKSRTAYLLDGSHLGGIGGEEASLATGCQDDIDGGVAVVGTTVYLPCLSGIVAVRATTPAGLSVLWSSGQGGGPPIVAAGLVWTIGQDGRLDGLSPATGAVRQSVSIGGLANHFSTPSVGDGLLLAPAAESVVAFTAASATTTATTAPATASTVPATTATSSPQTLGSESGSSSGGGLSNGNVAAIVIGSVLAVLVVAAALIGRRRRRRAGPPSLG